MPGTDEHPIEIGPAGVHVRAEARGRAYIDSGAPIALKEAGYDTVYYAPMGDVAMNWLEKSDKVTHCPFKGDATHFHAVTPNGKLIENAVWVYENPKPGMEAIKDHFAAYPDKLDVIREMPDGQPIL